MTKEPLLAAAPHAAKARAALTLARGAIEALVALGIDRKHMMDLLPAILDDMHDGSNSGHFSSLASLPSDGKGNAPDAEYIGLDI